MLLYNNGNVIKYYGTNYDCPAVERGRVMKYRKLGHTGIEVSEIGMGLEHLLDKDEQTVIETIKAAN